MSQNAGKVPEKVITDEKGRILNLNEKQTPGGQGQGKYHDRHYFLNRGHPGHKGA